MSRTGASIAKLAEDVREDLGDVAGVIAGVHDMIVKLGEAARAVNGLADDCRGWANHLASVLAEVEKAKAETPAKLLGHPVNPITQTVNADHAKAVRAAKEKSAA